MAEEKGLKVDVEGFNIAMEEARKKARSARNKVCFLTQIMFDALPREYSVIINRCCFLCMFAHLPDHTCRQGLCFPWCLCLYSKRSSLSHVSYYSARTSREMHAFPIICNSFNKFFRSWSSYLLVCITSVIQIRIS